MGASSQFHDGGQLKLYPHVLKYFSGIFPTAAEKLFMMMDMIKLINPLIVILSLASRSSEILLVNWVQNKPFSGPRTLF